MDWWAYIIVWLVSLVFPLFFYMANVIWKYRHDAWEKHIEEYYKYKDNSRFEMLCIFATLNCIFCAILFGLK